MALSTEEMAAKITNVLGNNMIGDAAPNQDVSTNSVKPIEVDANAVADAEEFYDQTSTVATSQTGSNNVDNYSASYTPEELEAPAATAYTYDPFTVGKGTTYDAVTSEAVTGQSGNVTPYAGFDVTKANAYDAGWQGYNATTADAVGYNAATGNAQGYNAALVGDSANYTPEQVQAQQYEAYMREVQANDLARNQLNQMLDEDSDYIKRARTAGLQHANSRGLLNTSFAAGAAHGAAIDRAAPIAMQDAGTYNQRALADMQYRNQANAQNAQMRQQAGIFNADASNVANRFAGENARFDTGSLNDANRFNANAMNTQTFENMRALNTQYGFNAGAQNQAALANAGLLSDAAKFGAEWANKTDLQNAQNRTNVGLQNAQMANLAGYQNAGFQQESGILDSSWFNKLFSQGLDAQNQRGMQDDRLNTGAAQDTANWQQQTNVVDQGAINRAGEVNTGRETDVGVGNADRTANINKFNVTTKQGQVQFDNTLKTNKEQFASTQEYNKWRTEFVSEHDESMEILRNELSEGRMSLEAATNMTASFSTKMTNMLSKHSDYIHEIEMSTQYRTPADKKQAIADATALRDLDMNMLFSVLNSTVKSNQGFLEIDLDDFYFDDIQSLNQTAVDTAVDAADEAAAEAVANGPHEPTMQASEAATEIKWVYDNVLQSDDPEGIVWYVDEYMQGRKTMEQIKSEIVGSDQFRDDKMAAGTAATSDFYGDVYSAFSAAELDPPTDAQLEQYAQRLLSGESNNSIFNELSGG